ncbi:MAG: phosphate ABC transporter substrate-binding protein [Gammaproteobacteria bacterium]|nr:MAG: phosphate ABC transporter substrate-binding protein [Gammaproteobacteria bacterium]
MNRRNLLKGLVAGGVALAAGKRANPGPSLPTGSFCRAPRGGSVPLVRGPFDLAYQGTHILTYGALQAVGREYRSPQGGRLLVTGGGCDDGIAAVREGRADLGGMCCPVAGSHARDLPWRQLAWDIKVAVVHPDLPLRTLSLAALRDIASGAVRRWGDLGAGDRPVALVVRRHCPDKLEPVRDLLLAGRPAWSPRSLWVDTDQQLVDTVARFPGAIGLVSRVLAAPMLATGRLRALHVDGAPPTPAAIRAGQYPLKGPLSVVFREWEDRRMQPLFDFLASARGQALLGRQLVPVTAVPA